MLLSADLDTNVELGEMFIRLAMDGSLLFLIKEENKENVPK